MKKKKLRIAFVGAGNTGKTTTMEYFSKKYNFPIKQCTTEKIRNRYGLKNHSAIIKTSVALPILGIRFQKDLIKSRIEYFRKVCVDTNTFVTDRTPLDSLAYTYLQNSFFMTDRELNLLEKQVKKAAKYYDYIFFFPVNKHLTLVNDGMRPMSLKYQEMVQTVMLDLAERLGYNLIEIPVIKNVKKRAEWIHKYLEIVSEENSKVESIYGFEY